MQIKEITNQKTWNEFFNRENSPSFLQSWEWGNFQKSIGYQIYRIGLYEGEKLIAIAQTIIIRSRRGNFLFIPHGLLTASVEAVLRKLKQYLITLAKQESCSFIRVAPLLDDTRKNRELFKDLGFKKAPIYMHAERMWILSLTSEILISDATRQTSEISDEQLLSQMRKTTRYLIRRAQRDGVIIDKRTDPKAVEDFYSIYQQTAKREKFVPFSKEFIRKEFEAFNKTNHAIFLFARMIAGGAGGRVPDSVERSEPWREGEPRQDPFLASALILFTKSTAFYHQGASLHTKTPATYLLQWEAIKEAKKRSCLFYNFWGILQERRTPKNWGGFTLFKTGFGGFQKDCIFTQDYILSPKYYITYLYEQFLGWKRGI